MQQVFTNQSSDATSEPFRHVGNGRALNVYLAGDLGGGTVSVETLTPDGSQWVPMLGGDFTRAGMQVLTAGALIGRLRLNGATAPNLNAWVESDDSAAYWRVMGAVL